MENLGYKVTIIQTLRLKQQITIYIYIIFALMIIYSG